MEGWVEVLKTLVFLPVVGAAVMAAWPAASPLQRWRLAVGIALSIAGLALWIATRFDPALPGSQLAESHPWNVRLGSYFALGLDGLSLAMVLLTALLTLVAALASRPVAQGSRLYYPLLFLLQSAMFGVFLARDWSLFYVFWEATLIPLFFLIDRLGGEHRQRAALNFFLYTLGGSVFMLVALLFLYDAAPGHSFAMHDMAAGGRDLPLATQLLILAGLGIGFGVKMPVFPLHGWLPLAHVEAPGPISILLSGVLLKMGAYGLLRAVDTLPAAFLATQDLLAVLALVTVLYGAILAWQQQDLKAMVAYASISHMGLVLLGIAGLNAASLTGAMLQMVAHGLAAALLFLLVGSLYARTHARDLARYGSLLPAAPRLAAALAGALLIGVGLPGSAGFIAELHVLYGGIARWGMGMGLPGLALLIAAAYSLRVGQRLCLPGATAGQPLPDLSRSEVAAVVLLVLSSLACGLWPAPLIDLLQGSLQALLVALRH